MLWRRTRAGDTHADGGVAEKVRAMAGGSVSATMANPHNGGIFMTPRIAVVGSMLVLMVTINAAVAQQPPAGPPTTPYGDPITFEAAKKVMAAAEAEAMDNDWPVAIGIVDSTGHLVMLHKLDNTQYASIAIAEGKARTALDYRRPTKQLEDAVAGGGAGLRVLALPGAWPLEGGVPIVVDGKIIGAIGVSGVLSSQDAQIAEAGAEAAAAR
jgi:glc operon protein GlcG